MLEATSLLLLIGGFLILLGVVGGGLHAREIHLPRISVIARMSSIILGIALVCLGIYEEREEKIANNVAAQEQDKKMKELVRDEIDERQRSSRTSVPQSDQHTNTLPTSTPPLTPHHKPESASAEGSPEGVVAKYFSYVESHDATSALSLWKDISPSLRNRLTSFINSAEYVMLNNEEVESRGVDWAVVAFRITTNGSGGTQKWDGAYELQYVDGEWKITRQTRAELVQ